MKNEGLIPRKTAALMIFLAETRNAAEYEDEGPTWAESEAVKNAWAAIVSGQSRGDSISLCPVADTALTGAGDHASPQTVIET